jgi:hypothetical protein
VLITVPNKYVKFPTHNPVKTAHHNDDPGLWPASPRDYCSLFTQRNAHLLRFAGKPGILIPACSLNEIVGREINVFVGNGNALACLSERLLLSLYA